MRMAAHRWSYDDEPLIVSGSNITTPTVFNTPIREKKQVKIMDACYQTPPLLFGKGRSLMVSVTNSVGFRALLELLKRITDLLLVCVCEFLMMQ